MTAPLNHLRAPAKLTLSLRITGVRADGYHLLDAEMDVLACALSGGTACVLLLSFRNGMNQGTRPFFPRLNGADSAAEVLEAAKAL